MKNTLLYFVFLLLIGSCLVSKTKEIPITEIRPLALVEEFEDTSFILGSKKVYITNEPYYLESIDDFVPNLVEKIEDTLTNIKIFRTYYSSLKIMSQQAMNYNGFKNEPKGIWFEKDSNENLKYLIDFEKKQLLEYHKKDLFQEYELGKRKIEDYIRKHIHKENINLIENDLSGLALTLSRGRIVNRSGDYFYHYKVLLKDRREVTNFTFYFNPTYSDTFYSADFQFFLNPINLKYSEIGPLINQIDSVESIKDYMEILLDSVNNDLLLKVDAKKKHEKTGSRTGKGVQLVFYINVHTKKVKKVSEKNYTSIWME